MKKVRNETEDCEMSFTKNMNCNQNSCAGSGAIYGFGLIGAAIYFIGQATSFWMGVLGLLKAMVWPAYVVYELLNFLMK